VILNENRIQTIRNLLSGLVSLKMTQTTPDLSLALKISRRQGFRYRSGRPRHLRNHLRRLLLLLLHRLVKTLLVLLKGQRITNGFPHRKQPLANRPDHQLIGRLLWLRLDVRPAVVSTGGVCL
jgi:hypothetical protein